MGNLATSYARVGRTADARELREKTLALMKAKLGPDHPDTLISMSNLVNTYSALARHADALKLSEEMLALQRAKFGPDHPDTLRSVRNLVNVYNALGRLTEVIDASRKAVELSPKSVWTHTQLGAALARKGDLDGAIAEYRTIIELDAKSAWAHAELGAALCERRDFAGGATALQNATELSPAGAWPWYQLANARLALGQGEAYRNVCAEMMKRYQKNKDPYWANRILFACLPTSDPLADLSALIPLTEVASNGKPDVRALGAALYRNRKYPEALASLKQASEDRAWDHLFQAMAQHRLGNTDKAREHLKIAVERIEKSGYTWTERIESETLRHEAEALINGTAKEQPGPRKK
jgi:tetratricopeptide (TPR) repeat protein